MNNYNKVNSTITEVFELKRLKKGTSFLGKAFIISILSTSLLSIILEDSDVRRIMEQYGARQETSIEKAKESMAYVCIRDLKINETIRKAKIDESYEYEVYITNESLRIEEGLDSYFSYSFTTTNNIDIFNTYSSISFLDSNNKLYILNINDDGNVKSRTTYMCKEPTGFKKYKMFAKLKAIEIEE